ncbi:MAG: Ig-like domain-containing protein [Spirochaetes bacterium]|nr:Ig-like domain-containing protein [Spirochaetota bacterium]MBU1079238.1 Ig-like domain-containing protein [Spirochaetota bacterium]
MEATVAARATRLTRFSVVALLSALSAFGCKSPLLSLVIEEVATAVTHPVISATYPTASASEIPVNAEISITFSKNIDPATVNSGTLTIVDSQGAAVAGRYSVQDATVTFTATGGFAYGRTYTATVTSMILDTDGKSISEEYSWTFTTSLTADVTAPTLTSLTFSAAGVILVDGAKWTGSLTVSVAIDGGDDRSLAQVALSESASMAGAAWETYNASDPTYEFTFAGSGGLKRLYGQVKDGAGNVSGVKQSEDIYVDIAAPRVTNFLINAGASATKSDSVSLDVFATDDAPSGGLSNFRYRLEGGEWGAWEPLTIESDVHKGSAANVPLGVALNETAVIEVQAMDAVGHVSAVGAGSILYERDPPVILDVNWDDAPLYPYNGSVLRIAFNEEMSPASFSTARFTLTNVATSAPISGMVSLTSVGSGHNNAAELWGLQLAPLTLYRVTLADSVQDVAGNAIGIATTWTLRTGDALDTSAPSGAVTLTDRGGAATVVTLPSEIIATNSATIELDLSAVSDDYNSPAYYKIWGDNDGAHTTTEVSFVESAAWVPWSDLVTWHLPNVSGTKYVLCKFMDSARNESSTPYQLKIILDAGVAPTVTSVAVNGGAAYTNATSMVVRVAVSAEDLHSGVEDINISQTGSFDDEAWRAWTPNDMEWTLPDSDGPHTFYVKARDYLGNESAVNSSASIILDRLSPAIGLAAGTSAIEFKTGSQILEGPAPSDRYRVVEDFGIASYAWETVSGPGTVSFNASDPYSASEPLAAATSEGEYIIKVTAVDSAGNSGSATIPFIWDTTPPADTLSVTTSQYNANGQPEWSWPPVAGADFYRYTFAADPDWDDLGSFAYYESELTSFAPSTALADGQHTLRVTSWDDAGNRAASASASTTTVDTVKPSIAGGGQVFLTNTATAFAIPGSVSVTETGSGLNAAATLWTQISGSGTLTFSDTKAINPSITSTVAAGSGSVFVIRLSVTDNAGNANSADFTINWDREPPREPVVTGVGTLEPSGNYHTPDLTPTWFWQSGGNGAGVFKYKYDSSAWSSETAATSYTPPTVTVYGSNESLHTHYLQVQERDLAGNWSSITTKGIWVDNLFVSAPSVAANRPATTTATSITWTWSSGAGVTGNLYRYKVNGVYKNPSGSAGDLGETYTFNSGQAAGTATTYTFSVEEYNGAWLNKFGVSSITVDLQGPTPPTVSVAPITNDTTPTWGWATNGASDGTGIFRYQLDGTAGAWSANTTQTAYTPASALSEASHTLYVCEQDPLGNWSNPQGAATTIDVTPPVLNSVLINSDAKYTNTRAGLVLTISAVGESGLQMSILDYDPIAAWEAFEAFSSSKTVTVPAGDGPKNVYVRLKDSAGNISSYKYDTIILDTAAPTAGAISINGGETYTPSFDGYFDASAADSYASASEIYVQHAYHDGSTWFTSSWDPIGTAIPFDSMYTNGTGYKYVYARFKDLAGNLTSAAADPSGGGWIYDSIYMQVPTMGYVDKGVSGAGTLNVYYYEVTDPAGDYVNRYYIYSTADPDFVPTTSTTGMTYHGYADQTASSFKNVYVTPGELRYFWVRAYNADSGGYGYFSPGGTSDEDLIKRVGFSSNVTVVYDDAEPKDVLIAGYIKALLEDSYWSGGILSQANMAGTMPSYSVTLLPERLVSNASYGSFYKIYGDPIIVTPGATFSRTLSTYDVRARNIASGGNGLIAMGANGITILDRIEDNWSAWGLTGTAPTQIGGGESAGLAASMSAKTRAASVSESIWHSPMQNTYLTANFYSSSINLSNIFNSTTGNVSRNGVYLGANPVVSDGVVYAAEESNGNYYPVVRQGRFLQFGYEDVPGRGFASATTYQYGQVFFINLVARMDDF